jgi:hypothetical protein
VEYQIRALDLLTSRTLSSISAIYSHTSAASGNVRVGATFS